MAAKVESSATKKQGGLAGLMDSVLGGIGGIIGTSQQGAMAASGFSTICRVCARHRFSCHVPVPRGSKYG